MSPATDSLASLKPGQNISCTIAKVPLSQDARDTIARLMRLDPANRRALQRAQRMRRQRMNVYNRGNRDWVSRELCAKVVRVATGQNWTMRFNLDLARDLSGVASYLSIKNA
jgi:hypothetical protein